MSLLMEALRRAEQAKANAEQVTENTIANAFENKDADIKAIDLEIVPLTEQAPLTSCNGGVENDKYTAVDTGKTIDRVMDKAIAQDKNTENKTGENKIFQEREPEESLAASENVPSVELEPIIENISETEIIITEADARNDMADNNDTGNIDVKNRLQSRKRLITLLIIGATLALLLLALVLLYPLVVNDSSSNIPVTISSFTQIENSNNSIDEVESISSTYESEKNSQPEITTIARVDSIVSSESRNNTITNIQQMRDDNVVDIGKGESELTELDSVSTTQATVIPVHENVSQTTNNIPTNVSSAVELIINTDVANSIEEQYAENSSVTFSLSNPTDSIDSVIAFAYQLYQMGNYEQAKVEYESILVKNSQHRGALLGLATIAIKQEHYAIAIENYSRLLQRNPSDPLAQAGIINITNTDLLAQESTLKNLINEYPDLPYLEFVLGNIFATQDRWNEAQQAYFNALTKAKRASNFSAEISPDYAYNLAITLEYLGKPELSVEYYQEALTYAEGNSASFDVSVIENRLEILSQKN